METQSRSKIKNILKFLAIVFSGVGLVALFVAGIFLIRNEANLVQDNQSVVLADTSGTCGPNATYTLTDAGVLTISGTGDMTASYPSPWTPSAVKRVVIESGITSISSYAFENHMNLEEVTVPSSVTNIGYYAFKKCRGLKRIILSEGLESIGFNAFENCTNLRSITLPQSLLNIGESAFYGCSLITSLRIPKNVSSIGSKIVSNCASLSILTVDPQNSYYNDGDGCNVIVKTSNNTLIVVTKDSVIPNTVTAIGDYVFEDAKDLTEIFIPNGVTSIGFRAFYNCENLTSITLPNSITSIGYEAFRGCYNIEFVSLGNSLININGFAFYGCSKLTSITLPNTLTTIGECAFGGCSLTSVNLPNGLSNLGSYAFSGNNISSINIPTSLVDIPLYAFYGLGINSITIPNTVRSIGEGAFSRCSNLTSITIPNSVTTIGASAFEKCEKLISIRIPSSVTSIEGRLLDECYALISIVVDSGNTVYNDGNGSNKIIETSTGNIIDHLLYDMSGTCGDGISWSISSNGTLTITGTGSVNSHPWSNTLVKAVVVSEGVTSIPSGAFSGCNITSASLPNSLTSIGEGAFSGCGGLTSINIPSNVTSIGRGAFSGCRDLTSINIPSGVTTIQENTFNGCSSLTSITISNGVTSIEHDAFTDCSSLTSINIPSSVTSLGAYSTPFYGCSSLESITVDPNNSSYLSEDGILYNKNKTALIRFPQNKECALYTLPDTVTSAYYSFEDCVRLRAFTMSDSCPFIPSFKGCTNLISVHLGKGAGNSGAIINFTGCNNLTTITISSENTRYDDGGGNNCIIETYYNKLIVGCKGTTIPNTVTEIGNGAFRENLGLTSIVIPNSVETIGGYAFLGCENLASITLGSGLTHIAQGAFMGCTSLTTIIIPISMPDLPYSDWVIFGSNSIKHVIFSDGVETIGQFAFYELHSLESVVIPSSVTRIGNHAFRGCTNLESIEIPDGVETIGQLAFYECSNLTSVTIGDDVTSIGDSAFYQCGNIKIAILGENVASIGGSAFAGNTDLKVILKSTTIPTINTSGTFGSDSYSRVAAILVPQTVVEDYKTAWPNYASIIEGYTPGSTQFTILWQNWNGDELEEDLVNLGDIPVYTSAIPTRTSTVRYNYEWDGWTTPIEIAKEDTTYVANYLRNGAPYTITYDANDGSNRTLTQNVIYSGSFTTYNYDAFARNGYRIVGWSRDPSLQAGIYPDVNTLYDFGDTENITLYAMWELEEYTITTTVDGIEAVQNYTVESANITLVNPEKDYYNFEGWTGSNGEEPELVVIIPTGSYGNKEYTANFTPTEYTITYTLNGGDATNPTVYTVESESITLVNPTKAGYNFVGWTGSNGEEPSLEVIIPTGSHENKAYTANWEMINYYLTYDLNGGSGNITDTTAYHITDVVVLTNTEPTKNGYTFNGWKHNDTTVTQVTFGVGDITVVADWTVVEYTISYTLNGGSATNPTSYTVESESIVLTNPTKLGYTFTGWTGSNGDEPSLEVVILAGSTENKAYTANWSEPIVYTITYTLNGGTATNTTTYTVESNAITLTNPTKPGYNFVGWTGSNGDEPSLEVVIESGSTENKVYTANWSEPIVYTISYTLNGGIATNPTSYTVESEGIILANPTKDYYTFVGWTGSNGEEAQTSVTIPTGSVGNKTYTANFTPVVYTITYTLNGGEVTNPTSYTVESESITLTNPTKAGYTFLGWTGSNGEEQSLEIVIPTASTGNKEYVANWSLNQYKIILHIDGETKVINYNILSKNQVIEKPSKKGYIFKGWTGTDLDEATLDVVVPQGSIGNKEYTATWEEAPASNLALIIGLSVAGGVLLLAIILIIVLVKRRKNKKTKKVDLW